MRPTITMEEAERRFPRLLRSMRWASCLSTTEAAAAVRDWYNRAYYGYRVFGAEAVEHGGGVETTIKRAAQARIRGCARRAAGGPLAPLRVAAPVRS